MKEMREWRLEGEYFQHVEASYDRLAPRYDADIGSNLVGRRMHTVFRRALREVLRPGQHVFEIGCGTGADALWLARQGLDVVATDISGAMIEQLREKAASEGLSQHIQTRRMAAHEIGRLGSEFGSDSFDGGFCHAGALNMEPEIARVPAQIVSITKPGGAFVCSFINRTSLFEILFYPLVLRPRKAFRRMGNVVPIPISRTEPMNRQVIPARFYSPSEMIRLFGNGFSVEMVQGMEIFLPPSNLADLYARFQLGFAGLEALEEHLSRRAPANEWGHHTVLVLRRR